MPTRRSGGATVRRKHSIGNLRRAHPASGATWNVQVVRGKMSSKCLWHACRALVLGLTLMLLGAGMATIGYYADHLSTNSELRGNATVRVKNDLKGFHLNNLSYVGPIVMGFGGFIVVASCVMTFEARDSAAKVVPARFRAGASGSKTTVRSNQSSATSQRRAVGIQLQSSRWDQQFGVFRTSPAEPPPQTTPQPFDRDALTAELVKFSKSLRSSTMSDSSYSGRWTARCASMASRASSIDSRRIQVDLHSPEVLPKSILRSPKRYSSGPSATPSVEKEFRSQLSVCSEPPAPIHQLSGQSSLEPCFPEELIDNTEEKPCTNIDGVALSPDALNVAIQTISMTSPNHVEELPPPQPPKKLNSILKKPRPDTLCLATSTKSAVVSEINKSLCRSNSSRTFYRPKPQLPNELDDSIFYIRSSSERQSIDSNELYDSVQVINERRTTLLRAESEAALYNVKKASSFSLLAEIPERAQNNSVDVEENTPSEPAKDPQPKNETTVEIESESTRPPTSEIT
ncbi:uncharacterized protein LOC120778455 isoform X3 [Bactrocera tryoni]|uniref:uncharacterized protein LOC120778455 isoform X3 n=1 Tax=Bactrocera tryoni TaxID=59916 RepID=UPI001A99982A|nr:uncharacterized protein LOC120778455 isoform X3 [Bactrocera tryoni]